jgi:hypothetical protein
MPRNRIEAKHDFSVFGFRKVKLACFGPTKDRSLAGLREGRGDVEVDQFDLRRALIAPTFERCVRTANYQETLSFDRDPCSPFLHARYRCRRHCSGKQRTVF